MITFGAQRSDVWLFTHHPTDYALFLLIAQSLSQREIRCLITTRSKIVRPIVKLRRDLVRWNEPGYFNFSRSFPLQAFQFFFIKNDEGSGFDFEPLPNLFIGNFFAGIRIDHVLLHACFRSFIENVKTNCLILHGRIQLHRHPGRIQFQITFPDCARGHGSHLTFRCRRNAARTEHLDCYRAFNAHFAKRSVTRDTPILRLNYIRVTACRTDFAARLKPPGLIPLSVTHSFDTQTIIRAFSVPQSDNESEEESSTEVGKRSMIETVTKTFFLNSTLDIGSLFS